MNQSFVKWLIFCLVSMTTAELLQNGGFESLAHWDCWSPVRCVLTAERHSGQYAVEISGRQEQWQGPSQYIQVKPGYVYEVTGYVRILDDQGHGQAVEIELDYHFTDDTHDYARAATQSNIRATDGWIRLAGGFSVPNKPLLETRIYVQGADIAANFSVDDLSVTEVGSSQSWRNVTDNVIDQLRKSDITIRVTAPATISKADTVIHVLQIKKSFPFGIELDPQKYKDNVANGRLQNFIHKYFNWAVFGNALKWYAIEPNRGDRVFEPALSVIHSLLQHGLKVRGHNLIWSVEQYVQYWVKQLYGDELKQEVKHHIEDTLNATRGLLEQWDAINENLHGHWYRDRLQDPDYDTEIFHIAHQADPDVDLFLNEYNIVVDGEMLNAYLAYAKKLLSANVGLSGLGVQCHFGDEEDPDPNMIKRRLDILSEAGLPIWVTELSLDAQDDDLRADYLEKALRATYGHPSVEGILFWGFWEENVEGTATGRRVIDLLDNQWMTDETRVLSEAGDEFTVRGFHGDYEARVIYKGQERNDLTKTFTLGKEDLTVNILMQN